MRFTSVVFDFDGTLADTGPGIILTIKALIQKYGLRQLSDEEIQAMIGPPIQTAFPEVFGITDAAMLEELIQSHRSLFNELALPTLRAFPGVKELLMELLDAGIQTGVATCKTQHVCEEQASCIGIRPYLNFVCGVRAEQQLFEKSDILETVLQEMGADKQASVMIGDRMHDIIGANIVGIPAIGVTYGSGAREELLAHKPLCLADSIEALRHILLFS